MNLLQNIGAGFSICSATQFLIGRLIDKFIKSLYNVEALGEKNIVK